MERTQRASQLKKSPLFFSSLPFRITFHFDVAGVHSHIRRNIEHVFLVASRGKSKVPVGNFIDSLGNLRLQHAPEIPPHLHPHPLDVVRRDLDDLSPVARREVVWTKRRLCTTV